MIRDSEIKNGLKKLRGEIPNGKVYNPDGSEYHETSPYQWMWSGAPKSDDSDDSGRDDGWRTKQAKKSIKDILKGI